MNHLATLRQGTRGLLPMLVMLTVVCATGAGVLAAEGDDNHWELGLFAGYGFLDDYDGGSVDLLPDDDMLFGLRIGYFTGTHWSAEGSYQMLSTETDLVAGPPNADVDLRSIRFNVLRHFRSEKSLRPFVTLGVGNEQTDVTPGFNQEDLGYNAGGGVRWLLREHFGLRGDVRWVSTNINPPLDTRQSNLEATVGFLWKFGGGTPGDADGDGVDDRKDKCPDTPRGAKVDETGCPLDSDGDGVYDGLDKCPNTPAGVPVDDRGCPKDSDGDGVHDGLDKCPDTPKGAVVDAKGCPKDSDGDGVYDGLDKCPDTPKGAVVDAKGCPKDSDGDGVYDGLDKCPDTAKGAKVDARGCAILFEEGRSTLVLEGVHFEFDSDQLTAESTGILDKVVHSLQDWKEVRVQVAGHTDSKGRDDYNEQLSQKRAESVRRYLISKGVAASRLGAKGYGESRPIADNDTEEGRAQNRRVELNKLD